MLSDDLKLALCPRLCARVYTVEVVRYSDGTEERTGEPPPPWCAPCPERSNPKPPIRRIVVVRTYPEPGAGKPKPIDDAVLPPDLEREAEPLAAGAASPGPLEHGTEDEALAHMMRRQQREDEAFARGRARRRNRGGPIFNPEDFGVT